MDRKLILSERRFWTRSTALLAVEKRKQGSAASAPLFSGNEVRTLKLKP